MCMFSVFVVFCVALFVRMQNICDGLICSPRIPISGRSSKTQKLKVSDPGEHLFKKKIGNGSRKLLSVNVCQIYIYIFGLPCLVVMR